MLGVLEVFLLAYWALSLLVDGNFNGLAPTSLAEKTRSTTCSRIDVDALTILLLALSISRCNGAAPGYLSITSCDIM